MAYPIPLENVRFSADKQLVPLELSNIPSQLMNDNILIEPFDHTKINPINIEVPDNMATMPRFGRVLAIGPGRLSVIGLRLGCGVEVGDIVVMQAFKVNSYGIPFRYQNKIVVMIPEYFVYGIINIDEVTKINEE